MHWDKITVKKFAMHIYVEIINFLDKFQIRYPEEIIHTIILIY